MYAPIYGITVIEAESYSNRSDALTAIKNRVFEPITGLEPGGYDSATTNELKNSTRHTDDSLRDPTVGHDPAVELRDAMNNLFTEDTTGQAQNDSLPSSDQPDGIIDVVEDVLSTFFDVDPSDISPDMSGEELAAQLGVDVPTVDPTQADTGDNIQIEPATTDEEELDRLVEKAESVEEIITATSEDAVTPGAKLYRQIGNRIKRARNTSTDTSVEEVYDSLERNPTTDNVVVAPLSSPAGKLLFEDAWVRNVQAVARDAYSHDNRGQTLLHEVPVDEYSDRLSTIRTRVFTDGEHLPETIVSRSERDRVIEFAETSDADVWIAPAMAHY